MLRARSRLLLARQQVEVNKSGPKGAAQHQVPAGAHRLEQRFNLGPHPRVIRLHSGWEIRAIANLYRAQHRRPIDQPSSRRSWLAWPALERPRKLVLGHEFGTSSLQDV
jgi:hypothetical protein